MSYQQSRYDPDYETPDFPPPSPRKARWYMINLALMAMVPLAAFSGLVLHRWFWLALIWGGAAVSALFGVIINPNFSMFREDSRKAFWQTYAVLVVVCAIMTYFVLNGDFVR